MFARDFFYVNMLTAWICVCTDWGFFSSLCSRQHNHGYLVTYCTLDPLLTVCVLKLLAHSLLLLGFWNHQSVLSAGPTHAVKWQLHQKFPLASKKLQLWCDDRKVKCTSNSPVPAPPPQPPCGGFSDHLLLFLLRVLCFRLSSCLISATFFKLLDI